MNLSIKVRLLNKINELHDEYIITSNMFFEGVEISVSDCLQTMLFAFSTGHCIRFATCNFDLVYKVLSRVALVLSIFCSYCKWCNNFTAENIFYNATAAKKIFCIVEHCTYLVTL